MKHLTPLAVLLFSLSALAQPRKSDVANQSYGPHERNVLDLYLAKSDMPPTASNPRLTSACSNSSKSTCWPPEGFPILIPRYHTPTRARPIEYMQ